MFPKVPLEITVGNMIFTDDLIFNSYSNGEHRETIFLGLVAKIGDPRRNICNK
jgi:hypothetical protein